MTEFNEHGFPKSLPPLYDKAGFLKPTGEPTRPADFDTGRYLMTAGSRYVNLIESAPDQIEIEDIAHSLSRIERWGGHAAVHYSVADHCVVMARAIDRELSLPALLHDAAEAYLGDMIRPVKRHCREFVEMESRLETTIAKAFGLPSLHSPAVTELDHYMIKVESEEFFGTDLRIGDKQTKVPNGLLGSSDGSLAAMLKTHLQTYTTWESSKRAFLEQYNRIRERERKAGLKHLAGADVAK